jgi:hypothetical protein
LPVLLLKNFFEISRANSDRVAVVFWVDASAPQGHHRRGGRVPVTGQDRDARPTRGDRAIIVSTGLMIDAIPASRAAPPFQTSQLAQQLGQIQEHHAPRVHQWQQLQVRR